MPAAQSLWRVRRKKMTRKRETAGREVLPGVQGKREAPGAVLDGQSNEVIVRTEASARERIRLRLDRELSLWVAAFARRPRLHVPLRNDDQNLRRHPNA